MSPAWTAYTSTVELIVLYSHELCEMPLPLEEKLPEGSASSHLTLHIPGTQRESANVTA